MGGEERKVWVGRRGRCGWGGEEGVGGEERKVQVGRGGREKAQIAPSPGQGLGVH